MQVTVHFYSYFKDLTGCAQTTESIAPGSTVADLHDLVCKKYPKLQQMKRSTLIAVGVDYQRGEYGLNDGDEVSFFPPVQGG